MSIDLGVYLERSKLPTFSEWSQGISDAGFPLHFPGTVNLAKHSGYLPAVFRDEESGFEFSLSTLDDDEECPDDIQSELPAVDAVAWFRFTETNELLAATAAAAVLAHLSNGVFELDEGRLLHGHEAVGEARIVLDTAFEKEKEEAAQHPENLPTAKWAMAFEESLRRVHTGYGINDDYPGRDLECVREDVTGLFLSQSCVKTHDRYHHCFAVLFTRTKPSGALCNPFVFGSRFDHNATISNAYHADYQAGKEWRMSPREWHSVYRPTLRDAREWVETTGKSAEDFLRPLYLKQLSEGADRVTALFQDAAAFLNQWGVSEETLTQPVAGGALVEEFAREFRLDDSSEEWNAGLVACFNAVRLADANGFSGVRLLKHRRDAFNTKCKDIAVATKHFLAIPEDLRNAAIFAAYIEDFLAVQAELPHMLLMIQNVKDAYPQGSSETGAPPKSWWRLW